MSLPTQLTFLNRCARSACFFFRVSLTSSFKLTLELATNKHAKSKLASLVPRPLRAGGVWGRNAGRGLGTRLKLAGKVVRKSYLCPHAARGYCIKLQRQGYTARRTTDHEKITIEQTSVGLAHAHPIIHKSQPNKDVYHIL